MARRWSLLFFFIFLIVILVVVFVVIFFFFAVLGGGLTGFAANGEPCSQAQLGELREKIAC